MAAETPPLPPDPTAGFLTWFPLAFLLLGGGVGLIGWLMLRRARASRRWPSVEGRVLASGIAESGPSGRLGSGGHGRTATLRVSYAYEVDGSPFQSSRVSFHDAVTKSPAYARSIAERYPAGSPVRVYYDPSRPDQAVLDRTAGCAAYLFLFVGGVLFAVGAVLLAFLLL